MSRAGDARPLPQLSGLLALRPFACSIATCRRIRQPSGRTHFAKASQLTEQDTHSALLFRIGADWFALPTDILDEVAELRTVRPLPHRRIGIVLGLVNVRGELIVCVSLGKFLGFERSRPPASRRTSAGRLVVLNDEGQRMAFPVDEVHAHHPLSARAT